MVAGVRRLPVRVPREWLTHAREAHHVGLTRARVRPGCLAARVGLGALHGGWLDDPGVSGVRARALASAMAREHLGSGHDVVVPQYLGRLDYIEELEQLARRAGVPFVEVMRQTPLEDTVSRFARRTAAGKLPEHRDAAALVGRAGGRTELQGTHERLRQVVVARPHTRLVTVHPDDVDATYEELMLGIRGQRGTGT